MVDGQSTDQTVENASGDFVAFTDADCIPEKGWLENLVKEFDDGIVGVGGGIKNIGEGLWEKSINLASDTFLGSDNSLQRIVLKTMNAIQEKMRTSYTNRYVSTAYLFGINNKIILGN